MAGEVCGAVSGAVLAIGLLYGETQPETATRLTEAFMHRFKEKHGKVRCIDIVGFNIGSADTKLEISSPKDFFLFVSGGGKRICNQAVTSAVRELVEVLNAQEA